MPAEIGEQVEYTPTDPEVQLMGGAGPYTGIVCGVNPDGTVNLAVFPPTGIQHTRTTVPYIEPLAQKPAEGPYCQFKAPIVTKGL